VNKHAEDESSAKLRGPLELLTKQVFEAYRRDEADMVEEHSYEDIDEFPSRDSIVEDFCAELRAGKIFTFDRNRYFKRASFILSRLCRKDTQELILNFLRHVLLESAQLYDEIKYTVYPLDMWYPEPFEFRADTFENQLILLNDYCHGKSVRRVEASLGGLMQDPSFFRSVRIPLSEELELTLTGTQASAGTSVRLVRELQSTQLWNEGSMFDTTLTTMRIYWGMHLSIDEVIERPPFGNSEFSVICHPYRRYPYYHKTTKVTPPDLQRFARFWKVAAPVAFRGAQKIAIDRLQRPLITDEDVIANEDDEPKSPHTVDRLIDLVIACDALLGEGGAEAVRKLSQRFACLLTFMFGTDPKKMHDLIAVYYQMQSKIVHGNESHNGESPPYPLDLEDAVRAVTGALLLSSDKKRRELISELDSILLERVKSRAKIEEQNFPVLTKLIAMRDMFPIYPNSGEDPHDAMASEVQ
jgi:hypothetical protein